MNNNDLQTAAPEAVPDHLYRRVQRLLGKNPSISVEHYLAANGYFEMDVEQRQRFSVNVVDERLDELERDNIYNSADQHPTGPSM